MKKIIIAAVYTLSLLVAAGAWAAELPYKKYERDDRASEVKLFELALSRDVWKFAVFTIGHEGIYSIPVADVRIKGRTVRCGEQIKIDSGGVEFPGYFISAKDIRRIESENETGIGITRLTYYAADTAQSQTSRRRRSADRVNFGLPVSVDNEQFVRGSIISYFGDITVDGEVNGSVVAVNGNILIGDSAVVRGDVVSVYGTVKLTKGSTVYGVVMASGEKVTSRRQWSRRWSKAENGFSLAGSFDYNRVDGATPMVGVQYDHIDSLLPSFRALAGYAFASKRWRYNLELTQTAVRGKYPLQFGGKVFRLLKSDDDKLIGDPENGVFALCFNEDWKDFYEAEGAYGFVRINYRHLHSFEIGYLAEEQRWLNGHPRLWSVFGTKEFRDNFSSVPYATLSAHRDDFDSENVVTSLQLKYTLDTRDDEKQPTRGWYGYAAYEYSPQRWKGDFDFKRFEASLRRYQPLGRYLSIDLKGAYGYEEGSRIPLNRYFYLGGLGTIHGYRHKEFRGTEYLLLSGDYLIDIPHSDFRPFIQFDGGKIAPEGLRLSGHGSWYSSIALGVDFQKSIRLFFAKRLDKSGEDPVFYARFTALAF